MVSGVAAAVMLGWGLGTPAFGMDEATSVVLARWTWPNLVAVSTGQDAPLGPYYLLLRGWLLVSSTEWWVRLPSMVPMALAVALLGGWVARWLSVRVAVVAVAVMCALPAVSRFAQEARPYGLAVLAAVASSLAWWRFRQVGGRRAGAWYAVSVLAVPLCNVLALGVVAAQVVAGFLPDRSRRPGVGWRTLALAAAGVAPTIPFLWLVATRATGYIGHYAPTPYHVWTILRGSFGGEPRDAPLVNRIAVVVVALALIGAVRLRPRRQHHRGQHHRGQRPVLVYLWLWALLPGLLIAVAALWRPTLVARYFLVSVPAWSALAALGCVVLASAVVAPIRRVAGGRGEPWPVARVVPAAVALLPVAVLAGLGWPRQLEYRGPGGHPYGDVRPAVALLDSPPYRQLPLLVAGSAWYTVEVAAYDPSLFDRTPLADGPRMAGGHVVLVDVDTVAARHRLDGVDALAVLLPTRNVGWSEAWLRDDAALTGFAVTAEMPEGPWMVFRMERHGG